MSIKYPGKPFSLTVVKWTVIIDIILLARLLSNSEAAWISRSLLLLLVLSKADGSDARCPSDAESSFESPENGSISEGRYRDYGAIGSYPHSDVSRGYVSDRRTAERYRALAAGYAGVSEE